MSVIFKKCNISIMFYSGLIVLSLLSTVACIEKGGPNKPNRNRALASQTRLFGGENATAGRYPYFVRLVGAGQCGGALIAPDIVVTAAHCE
jgi:secreted trypsin-like serine protease